MNNLAVLSATTPLLLAASPSEPLTVTANDLPIGRITCSSGLLQWASTGTIVENSRTVIAAAHFNTMPFGSGRQTAENCRFTITDYQDRVVFSEKVIPEVVGGDWRLRKISTATDWAVLRLERDAPPSLLPLKLMTGQPKLDFGDMRLLRFDYRVRKSSATHCTWWRRGKASALAEHTCSTSPGWSGAPMLVQEHGKDVVIGIHAARSSGLGLAVTFQGLIGKRVENAALINQGS